jgi:hypothetical protein
MKPAMKGDPFNRLSRFTRWEKLLGLSFVAMAIIPVMICEVIYNGWWHVRWVCGWRPGQ